MMALKNVEARRAYDRKRYREKPGRKEASNVAARKCHHRRMADPMLRVERNTLARARHAEYTKRPEIKHRKKLQNYNLTVEQLTTMWADQWFECPICLRALISPFDGHVDHNHKTGVVRGILCKYCNPGLGCFFDSAASLGRAITYLKIR